MFEHVKQRSGKITYHRPRNKALSRLYLAHQISSVLKPASERLLPSQ